MSLARGMRPATPRKSAAGGAVIGLATARKTYPAHRREVGGQHRGHVHRPEGLAHYVRSTIPARAPDKRPATRPFIEAKNRRVSCRLRIVAYLPPITAPHAARVPRCGMPVARRPPESAAAPVALRFPPSVFPFWEPPFQIPPFQRTPPKGANRRGQPHGGLSGKRRKTAEESAVFSAPFSAAALRWPRPAAAQSTPLR